MVRGLAKGQAQAKNFAKSQQGKKAHAPGEIDKIKQAGQTAACPTCMQTMPNVGALKQHFEQKHPKLPLPAICTASG